MVIIGKTFFEIALEISTAFSRLIDLGLFLYIINPIASAPEETAAQASFMLVIPQIFIKIFIISVFLQSLTEYKRDKFKSEYY